MKKLTIEERIEKAKRLKAQGLNCSQCVALSFSDVTGSNDDKMAALASCLGGGVGGSGNICGAITGASLVIGMAKWSEPTDKSKVYGLTSQLASEFKAENCYQDCRDLKGKGHIPCMQLIESAIRILDKRLAES